MPAQVWGAEPSVGANRRLLRGYGWVTVVPPELADAVGDASGLHEVATLPSVGLWLQATARPADYDDDAIEAMWRAVAPVLPDAMPENQRLLRMAKSGMLPANLWLPVPQLVMRPATEAR